MQRFPPLGDERGLGACLFGPNRPLGELLAGQVHEMVLRR